MDSRFLNVMHLFGQCNITKARVKRFTEYTAAKLFKIKITLNKNGSRARVFFDQPIVSSRSTPDL